MTPARQIYFPIMMMYLDETGHDVYYRDFTARMTEFMDAVNRPDLLLLCVEISKEVLERRFYSALRLCRRLMDHEQEILGDESERLSAHP